MANAKDIIVKPITAQAANAVVKRIHYSGNGSAKQPIAFWCFFEWPTRRCHAIWTVT